MTSGSAYSAFFTITNPNGTAMRADNLGTTGSAYGIYASSAGTTGRAIRGVSTATTGDTAGGSFSAASSGGNGVTATVSGAIGTGNGGFFQSSHDNGTGVYGNANTSDPNGSHVGVQGTIISHNQTSFGMFSYGQTGATGVKAFRIDHPADPTNKYLFHYSAEGPEPYNLYCGTVSTDNLGYAWVELPEYFQSINKSPRYQLTVVDDSEDFVLAKVTKKIQGSRFQIRTNKPHVEVSWEVKAVRNDPYMQRYPKADVVDKRGIEVGTYTDPALYDQPAEKGVLVVKELARKGVQTPQRSGTPTRTR